MKTFIVIALLSIAIMLVILLGIIIESKIKDKFIEESEGGVKDGNSRPNKE